MSLVSLEALEALEVISVLSLNSQLSTLNSQLSTQKKVFRFPFSAFRFSFSRPYHGAAILGVTGGGRSALTGGAPVSRLLGCAESF